MFYALPHSAGDGNIPAIFAFGVGTGSDVDCAGTTFEVRNFVGSTYSGWVCAAMMAADNVGNVGVSAPIAFCLHDGLDPTLGMVSSIVRGHVHVVRSSLIHSCKYFGDSINSGLSDQWRIKWWDYSFDFAF